MFNKLRQYLDKKIDTLITRCIEERIANEFSDFTNKAIEALKNLDQENQLILENKALEIDRIADKKIQGFKADTGVVLDRVVEDLFVVKHGVVPIKFQKTDKRAKAPTRAYTDDAGWDVYAVDTVYIPQGQMKEVRIGLAFEIPAGYHIQIHTRSSYGKKSLRCHLGIIDTGYRNEVSIWVMNSGWESHQVSEGDKVCQLLILPVPTTTFIEATELSKSERGLRGHGSSGK